MDYIFAVTGSSARVVRDAISQRFWPGVGATTGQVQLSQFDATHGGNALHLGKGLCGRLSKSFALGEILSCGRRRRVGATVCARFCHMQGTFVCFSSPLSLFQTWSQAVFVTSQRWHFRILVEIVVISAAVLTKRRSFTRLRGTRLNARVYSIKYFCVCFARFPPEYLHTIFNQLATFLAVGNFPLGCCHRAGLSAEP